VTATRETRTARAGRLPHRLRARYGPGPLRLRVLSRDEPSRLQPPDRLPRTLNHFALRFSAAAR